MHAGFGKIFTVALIVLTGNLIEAAEWQWSLFDGKSRSYLWIPPDCQRVRAVVLANRNMIEQGVLEHSVVRKTLAELGIGEVWVIPNLDMKFDPAGDAGERFGAVMDKFAEISGYEELKYVPVVTMGHSANATWPWNFAAWNPGRTLAVLSIHGDAPQTNLVGYGGKNPEWGERRIDGVPGLMVMSEYEWWEKRAEPMFAFKQRNPKAAVSLLADAGHGHFDCSDELVSLLAMSIRKSAQARLPESAPLDKPVELKAVDPEKGWLIDRWRKDKKPLAPAAPYAEYKGDINEALWCFDKEMADATEKYYASSRGKKPQLLSVTDDSSPIEKGCGEPVTPRFLPLEDGISFKLKTAFMDKVGGVGGNPSSWVGLPNGTPLGHAEGEGLIVLTRIDGPVEKIDKNTLRLKLGRAEYTTERRNYDMWILASHPGDENYKSAVQQCKVTAVRNESGREQVITFPEILDHKTGTETVQLKAVSDAGLPVCYYVLEGPAEIGGDILKFTKIPPRSKFPIKVTVVAWQWGRGVEPKVKTASPVERMFLIK